jgi:hypothetical protein
MNDCGVRGGILRKPPQTVDGRAGLSALHEGAEAQFFCLRVQGAGASRHALETWKGKRRLILLEIRETKIELEAGFPGRESESPLVDRYGFFGPIAAVQDDAEITEGAEIARLAHKYGAETFLGLVKLARAKRRSRPVE